ncbi:MAG: hypothetical protein ACJ74J_05395 [Blastocatellia bacterium]
MLKYKLFLAFFILGLCTSFPVNSDKDKLEVVVKYDKFEDRTTIRLGNMFIAKSRQNILSLAFLAQYEGQQPKKVEVVELFIYSATPKERFVEDHNLILLVDGLRLRLGKMALFSKTTSDADSLIGESLILPIPFETVKQISKGNTVEGKIGDKEFKLQESYLKLIREFVKHFESEQSAS